MHNKPHTEETKRKISLAHKGVSKGPHSEEARRKMSLAHKGVPSPKKGIPRSEETKRKLSLAHKGIPMSEEHNLNCALTRQKRISKLCAEDVLDIRARYAKGESIDFIAFDYEDKIGPHGVTCIVNRYTRKIFKQLRTNLNSSLIFCTCR